MTPDEILEIVKVYKRIEEFRTINWEEINRVYEFFRDDKQRFPREKVFRIKSFVENNKELILEAENDVFENYRRIMSIKIKNQIPVPKIKPRKIWVNKNIIQQTNDKI